MVVAHFFVTFLASILTLSAQEGGSSKGGITLTKYSAECKLDVDNNGNGIGGKNESPSGYKPLDWTLEKHREMVLVAVPQCGGTSDLFKKCFKIMSDGIDGNQVFFAGDRYGESSNGQNKIDISVECTEQVKSFKMDGATIQEVPCPQGQAQPIEALFQTKGITFQLAQSSTKH